MSFKGVEGDPRFKGVQKLSNVFKGVQRGSLVFKREFNRCSKGYKCVQTI